MLCCFSVSAKPRNHVFRILTLVKFMLELEVSHLLSRTAYMFALPCCDCRSVCVCFSHKRKWVCLICHVPVFLHPGFCTSPI